jgi:NCAIR mutase (PurE)-related protein
MDRETLRQLLEDVRSGHLTIDAAGAPGRAALRGSRLRQLDLHRALRAGGPEPVFWPGKPAEQVVAIVSRLAVHHANVLATRCDAATAAAVQAAGVPCVYHAAPRLLVVRPEPVDGVGLIVVAAAGTADLPVAEEAALVAEALGNRVERVSDCGVAGLHRLLAHRELLSEANAIVAVAGMEGALPSVIGGLVDRPVIAVPTSVGYGTSLNGLAALLAMLNSCAPGVSVVNIDNGYGAAHQASQINRLVAKIR